MLKVSATEPLPICFTAQSKTVFYCRDAICQYVFEQGCVPLNPFRAFDYFLGDRVDWDLVRQANNTLIQAADRLYVFGEVSDGVFFEMALVLRLGKPIRIFSVSSYASEIEDRGPIEDFLDPNATKRLEFEAGFLDQTGSTEAAALAVLREAAVEGAATRSAGGQQG